MWSPEFVTLVYELLLLQQRFHFSGCKEQILEKMRQQRELKTQGQISKQIKAKYWHLTSSNSAASKTLWLVNTRT